MKSAVDNPSTSKGSIFPLSGCVCGPLGSGEPQRAAPFSGGTGEYSFMRAMHSFYDNAGDETRFGLEMNHAVSGLAVHS